MQDDNRAYFTRSLALLRKDKGWMKPLLVLAAAALVPIVGLIGVQGYALEWARLTAWGVDAAPKQKDVRIGECIKSGWRGFLGGFGYVLVAMLINSVISAIIGDNAVSQIIGTIVSLIASVAYVVAALRATIYQDFMAGYRFDRIWEMVSRDLEGLVKILIINVAISFVVALVSSLLYTIVLLPSVIKWAIALDDSSLAMIELEYMDSATMRYLFFGFVDAVAASAPWLALVTYIASIGGTFATLINYTATGLWMRNFDVASWGASEDPLPVTNGLPAMGYTTQPNYGQPVGYGYGQPTDQQMDWQPYQAQPADVQQYVQPYEPEAYQPQPYDAQPYVPQEQEVPAEDVTASTATVTPIVLPPIDVEPQVAATTVTPIVVPGEMAPIDIAPLQEATLNGNYGRDVIEVVSLTDRQPAVIDSELQDDAAEPVQPEQSDDAFASASVEPVVIEPIALYDDVDQPETDDGTVLGTDVPTEPVQPIVVEEVDYQQRLDDATTEE